MLTIYKTDTEGDLYSFQMIDVFENNYIAKKKYRTRNTLEDSISKTYASILLRKLINPDLMIIIRGGDLQSADLLFVNHVKLEQK